jgi:S-adenosylmethionine:tRNA ribosyltransferase-isomerase
LDVDLFDFKLPQERIALEPARPRDHARMLVVGPDGGLTDGGVRDLLSVLRPGDLMIVNDTKVIAAELNGVRRRGEGVVSVRANLHKRVDGSSWLAFARPAKRLAVGDAIEFGSASAGEACGMDRLDAVIVTKGEGGEIGLEFELEGPALDEAISAHGALPLPPYIGSKRGLTEADRTDYQTVYSRRDGAVAAPTAGLHFTDDLLGALAARGVKRATVTLHVGAGTFLPVKAADTKDHAMHAEWGEVPPQTAAAIAETRARGGRVVAVGTTSLRLLESAVRDGAVVPFCGDTDIFITPGYRFGAVDVLLTNFHLPRSTLFMLVSAFAGLEPMKRAYAHAIAENYRFYSYGDATLLFRAR